MSECVEFTGYTDELGYGTVWDYSRKRMVKAHRIAFEAFYGPIRDGAKILHDCDNRRCINPLHLRQGTQAENITDMVTRRRGWWQSRTHCVHGHPFAGDNLIVMDGGKRACRTCRTRRKAEARERANNNKIGV